MDFADIEINVGDGASLTGDITALSPAVAGTDYDLSISSTLLSIDNAGNITIPSFETEQTVTYTVKATGQGNYQGTVADDFELNVKEPTVTITGEGISNKALTKTYGDSNFQLTATVTGVNGSTPSSGTIEWSSDDTTIASINRNSGEVTIKNAGTPARITATWTVGPTSITDAINITVNKRSVTSLAYGLTELNVTAGTQITDLTPTVKPDGATGTYSATLPVGLNINSDSGIISGTPTKVAGRTQYTITFAGNGNYTGDSPCVIHITVEAETIKSLGYPEIIGRNGYVMTAVSPVLDPPGATGTFSVTQGSSLPSGLSLNSGTGVISGTPGMRGKADAEITMTGTGIYEGKQKISQVDFMFSDSLQNFALDYPDIAVLKGETNGNTSLPSWTVPNDVIDYAIAPKLGGQMPGAITIDSDNGMITVDTANLLASATYTITVSIKDASRGYTGNKEVEIKIGVLEDLAAKDLSYANITASKGTSGNTSSPSWGDVDHSKIDYSIARQDSGQLPSAISINGDGVISVDTTDTLLSTTYLVTATAVSDAAIYTGSKTATLTILVLPSYGHGPNNFAAHSRLAHIQLTWNSLAYANSYTLYYGTSSPMDRATATKVEGVSSPHTHTNLMSGETYYYELVATTPVQAETPASEASAKPIGFSYPNPEPVVRPNERQYDFSYRADQADDDSSKPFGVIRVGWDPDTIKLDEDQVVTSEYTIEPTWDEAITETVTYSVETALPDWLVLNSDSGIASGTPALHQFMTEDPEYRSTIKDRDEMEEQYREWFYENRAIYPPKEWVVTAKTGEYTIGARMPVCVKISPNDRESLMAEIAFQRNVEQFGVDHQDLNYIDTSRVTSLNSMFSTRPESLPQWDGAFEVRYDVSKWDVRNVTSLYLTFNGFAVYPSTGIGFWDVSNVTSMEEAFANTSQGLSLNLTSWNVSNVTNMVSMFDDSGIGLQKTSFHVWDVSNVDNMTRMFAKGRRNGIGWVVTQAPGDVGYTGSTRRDFTTWAERSDRKTDEMFDGYNKATLLDVHNVQMPEWMKKLVPGYSGEGSN